MAYNKINWTNGSIRREGYVLIDGTQYQTVQPEYEGETPINADNLNHMEDGIIGAEEIDSSQLGTNGYIRLKNGLQIAWVEKQVSVTLQAWGNIYYADISNMPNWEVPFTSVYQQYVTSNNKQFWFSGDEPTITSPSAIRLLRATGGTQSVYVRAIAIGSWK